ncbi:Craniofacial development protein 2 [Nymphon striatum]|nr:Craniofacial development protein 2 [Nymphon striatum]
MMKLQSKPFNINIIQVYAPTQDYDDEEIETFYEEIQVAIKNTKSDDILCIMGDFNAKVGKEKHTDIVGNGGLGKRNERGERMIQFCILNKLFITNTWFQQPPRKLYTWKSPGDITRNQIDYIIINQRFRNTVKQVKTYPGADINSDHNPVVMKMNIKLKKMKKKHQKREQPDLNLLRQEEYRKKFNVEIENKYASLCVEEDVEERQQTENIEQIQWKWKIFKECIHESTKEVIPQKENNNNQKWMTKEILEMMMKRKQFKITDHNKYREINKKIITECRKAKDNWLNQQCQEIENLEQHFKAKEMHKRVKQLTGKSKTAKGSGCIKNKDGDILFEQEEIAARWVEYITELYEDEREPMPQFEITKGENILKDEVEKAIKSMKNGKATGPDHISAETLKALDENNIDILTNLCRVIYNNGQIPPEMKQSIFITLPKKHKTQNCSEHRTISLMSHVTKLLLKIILQRITNKINQEVSRLQSGFRSGSGTREGIFNLRNIYERSLEVQKDVYICFIDYRKAFDRTETKKRLVKCYIWSTLLYGAETWTLTKIMMTKIEAFEMWIYRRMLKISYTEHRTNEFVLRKIEAKRSLMNTIKKRKCTYFGHIMRKEDDLQRLLLEGKIQGRRGRGRPRTAWYHNIKEWTGMRYADCSRKAQNREEWRSMTANLLKADGTEDR